MASPRITVYVSGPMTGIQDWNFPEFERFAKAIRGLSGFFVWSHHEVFGGDTTLTRSEYLRADYEQLLTMDPKTDRIAMMPGWRGSEGAMRELLIAVDMGIDRFEVDINESGTICWRHIPDSELPQVTANWHELFITRRPGGQHLLTEMMPAIEKRRRVDVLDAWGLPGDDVDHQICGSFAGRLFGREFPLLKPQRVRLAGR